MTPSLTFLFLGAATSIPWSIAISFKLQWALADVKGNVGITTAVYLIASLLVFMLSMVGLEVPEKLVVKPFFMVNAFALLALTTLCMSNLEGWSFFLPFLVLTIGFGASAAAFQLLVFAKASQQGEIGNFTLGFSLASTCTAIYVMFICSLDERTGAICALLFGVLLEMCCYCVLDIPVHEHDLHVVDHDNEEDDNTPTPPIVLLTALSLTIFSTLVVFPGIVSRISPRDATWTNDCSFVGTLFTLFNAGDLLGRGMSSSLLAHIHVRPNWWLLASLLRVGLNIVFFTFPLENSTRRQDAISVHDFSNEFVRAMVLMSGWTQGIIYTSVGQGIGESGHTPASKAKFGKYAAIATNVALAVGSIAGGVVSSSL